MASRKKIGEAPEIDDIMGISKRVEALWKEIRLDPGDALVVRGWKRKGAKGLEFFVSSLIPETIEGEKHDPINARSFPIAVTVEFVRQVLTSGTDVYFEDTEKPPSWIQTGEEVG